MGYAYGQLYGQEISNNVYNLRKYVKSKVAGLLQQFGVPQPTIDLVYAQLEPLGFYLLDLNWNVALPYIPKRF
jgi:hypothetical protein